MKKLFVVLAAAAMFVACGPKEAVKVTVEDLAKHVGQEVEFTGSTVVCPETGDVYVMGATSEVAVKVLPAKDAAFDGVNAKEVTFKGAVSEVEVEGAKAYVVQTTSYTVLGDAKMDCPMADKGEKACCAGDSTKCAEKCTGDSTKCAEKCTEKHTEVKQ